jgi:hypothetical protein
MKKWILAASALLAISAQAQTLSGLKIEPAAPKAGEQVKITLDFSNADTPNCAMKISLGDGRIDDAKINKASDVPYLVTHTYTKPGSYTVVAEPERAGSTLKCSGKKISKAITVAAVAAPVAATPVPVPAAQATSAAKAMPAKPVTPCPEGWALAKPGVNKKTQAFTCTAKAGTKIPEPKLACPGDLTYFDNSKKGQLGCRV